MKEIFLYPSPSFHMYLHKHYIGQFILQDIIMIYLCIFLAEMHVLFFLLFSSLSSLFILRDIDKDTNRSIVQSTDRSFFYMMKQFLLIYTCINTSYLLLFVSFFFSFNAEKEGREEEKNERNIHSLAQCRRHPYSIIQHQ